MLGLKLIHVSKLGPWKKTLVPGAYYIDETDHMNHVQSSRFTVFYLVSQRLFYPYPAGYFTGCGPFY